MAYSKTKPYKRRALTVLLTLCMMIGMLPPLTMTAQAAVTPEAVVAARLYALRDRYPQNYYWNHAGPDLNGYGVTQVPCPSHDSYNTCNSYIYNGDVSYQCKGFAKTVFEEVFGQKCDDLPRNYDIENVMVGDYVRFGDEYAGHSFIVLERNGDEVTVLECNIGGRCIIQWGRVQSLSGALNYASRSSPRYVYFNYSVHASNYSEIGLPTGSAMPEDPSYRPIPDGSYYIVPACGGDQITLEHPPVGYYCLGVSGAPDTYDTNGADAALLPGYGNKAFTFTASWMENGFYQIKPRFSQDHSLAVADAGTQIDADVQLWEGQEDSPAQQWWISEREDGAGYTIRARCSGFYLNAGDPGTADGTGIGLWVDDGSFAQYWYLIPFGKPAGQTVLDNISRISTRPDRVIGGNADAKKQRMLPPGSLPGRLLHPHGYEPHMYSAGKYAAYPGKGDYLLWIIAGVLAAAVCGCLVILTKKKKKKVLTS